MKSFVPFVCTLLLLSTAAFAASHHAVTFTGAVYYDNTTNKIGTTIVNNTLLIMTFTSATTLKEAGAYDVVVNDETGEVDVIDKATRVIVHAVISINSSNGFAGNGPATAAYLANEITFALPPATPPFTGSEFILARFNAGGALVSSSASIIAGNGFEVLRAAYTTRPILYNF